MDKEYKIRKLMSYLNSIENDWDGLGGIPPGPKVIKNVRIILIEIPYQAFTKVDDDSLCINPNGTIGIEFDSDCSKTIIDVGENGMTVVYKKDGKYFGFDHCEIGYCHELKTAFKETGII